MNIMDNRLSINIRPLRTVKKLGITEVDMTLLTYGLLTYDSTDRIVSAPFTSNICPFRIKTILTTKGVYFTIS